MWWLLFQLKGWDSSSVSAKTESAQQQNPINVFGKALSSQLTKTYDQKMQALLVIQIFFFFLNHSTSIPRVWSILLKQADLNVSQLAFASHLPPSLQPFESNIPCGHPSLALLTTDKCHFSPVLLTLIKNEWNRGWGKLSSLSCSVLILCLPAP